MRQVAIELLEGDRDRPAAHPHPTGPRSSVEVPQRVVDALDAFTSSNRHPTKAALIAALVREFLEGRVERAAFQNRYSLSENLELKLDLAWVNDYREALLAFGVYF